MLRSLVWAVANLSIAVAVVVAGFLVFAATDPAGFADVGWTVFFAVFLLPWYGPTVVLHGALVSIAARWVRPRLAALALAPVAPGFLWLVVFDWRDPILVSVAAAGTAAFGVLCRLPARASTGPALVASAILMLPFMVFVGHLLALAAIVVVLAVAAIRRQAGLPEPAP